MNGQYSAWANVEVEIFHGWDFLDLIIYNKSKHLSDNLSSNLKIIKHNIIEHSTSFFIAVKRHTRPGIDLNNNIDSRKIREQTLQWKMKFQTYLNKQVQELIYSKF